jgi:hypothetical protein
MKYFVKIVDGQIDWNTLDSEQKEGLVEVPMGYPREALKVSEDGLSVVSDEDMMKRIVNAASKVEFINSVESSYNHNVAALLSGKSETRVLSEMLYGIFIYLKSLQDAAGVLDSAMSEQGQVAKSAIDAVASGMYSQIESLRASKAESISNYVPPYSEVDPLYP